MNYTPEQLQAIETVGEHVCVSAGAGSGKTRVLIDRIVYLLQHHDVELSGIVAITFTRKAASEMKERLRKKCYELAPEDDSAEMDRWRRVLHQIDTARITTIDSFCSGLLREHGLWMQDDPDYAVMSDADAKLEPRRVVEETLGRLLDEDDACAERVATLYGIAGTAEMLVGLLDRPNLHEMLSGYATGSVEEVGERWREVLERYVRENATRILGVVNDLCDNLTGFDHFFVDYRNLLGRIFEGILRGEEPGALVPLLEEAAGANFGKGRFRKELDRIEYDQLKELANDARDAIKELMLSYYLEERNPESAAITHDVATLYGKAFAVYRQHKRGRAIKDFSDLLRDALALLDSRGELRDRIAGSIRYLLIDEFQDTNPAQWELARRLMGTEEQSGPELFIVGDVKQSIYRFRNADVTVFMDAQREISEPILLSKNFRTLPNVMDGINDFFSESGLLESVVGPWESLEAHRPRAEGVHFEFLLSRLPGKINGKKTNVIQQRQAEATRIADHVSAMCSGVLEYRIQEEDREGGVQSRPIEYRDVALLFRAKSSMYLYENALKKYGVPYATLGGGQFFYRQEIADLTNLLRTLVDPWDEHALLGFLRSPMVGLSDNSIVRLGWRKGLAEEFRGDAVLDDEGQNDRLTIAREWTREFDKHASDPISELLQRIIVRTNYEAILVGLSHGEQRRSNVRKMVDTAREMTIAGKGSLSDFVKHLEEQTTPGVLEGDAPLRDENRNAVTLMTIHGSKGLEFPVVILPDTSRVPGGGGDGHHVASHAKYGFVAKAPSTGENDVTPAMFSLLREIDKREDVDEDARVLYVAMTRARDYLVVSGTVLEKEKKKKKGEDESGSELAISKKSWLGHFDFVFGLREVLEGGDVREGISVFSNAHGGRFGKGSPEDGATPVSISAAQIGAVEILEGDGEFVSTTAWLDERFPGPEGVSESFDLAQQVALVRGTMVHRYLELWDFSATVAPDVGAFLAEEYPAYVGDGEWVGYLEGVAGRLRDSEVFSVLREGGLLRRELPFMVSIGEQWISGTIDVLTGSGVIVDYKTGTFREESVARYETQLRLYAHALGELTGDAPGRGLLYFVDEGLVTEVDLGTGFDL